MNNAFLILSHIFAIANPEPDTLGGFKNVHLYLPPEAGQGNSCSNKWLSLKYKKYKKNS